MIQKILRKRVICRFTTSSICCCSPLPDEGMTGLSKLDSYMCRGAPSADELNRFFVVTKAGSRHPARVFVESLTELPARVWSGEVGACLLDDAAEEFDDRLFGNCLALGRVGRRQVVVVRGVCAGVACIAGPRGEGKAERVPGRCTGVRVTRTPVMSFF